MGLVSFLASSTQGAALLEFARAQAELRSGEEALAKDLAAIATQVQEAEADSTSTIFHKSKVKHFQDMHSKLKKLKATKLVAPTFSNQIDAEVSHFNDVLNARITTSAQMCITETIQAAILVFLTQCRNCNSAAMRPCCVWACPALSECFPASCISSFLNSPQRPCTPNEVRWFTLLRPDLPSK